MRDEEDHEERSADTVSQTGIERHMFDTLTLQACPTGSLVIAPGASDAVADVSLVLPTYNEGKNIAAVIEQLMPVLDSVEGLEYEVIVVDDDSPDRAWEIALGLTEKNPQLRVIRGWQIARGKILAVMDADLQHPPEVAAKLCREMLRGADMGIASRHVEGGGVSDWALGRRIISRGA